MARRIVLRIDIFPLETDGITNGLIVSGFMKRRALVK